MLSGVDFETQQEQALYLVFRGLQQGEIARGLFITEIRSVIDNGRKEMKALLNEAEKEPKTTHLHKAETIKDNLELATTMLQEMNSGPA